MPSSSFATRKRLALEAHLTANALAASHSEIPRVIHGSSTPAGVHSFELVLELSAPLARVWQALTQEIDAWWRRDFFTSARTRRFVLEARVGGRLYEDAGDGEGLQWAQVIGIEAPTKLDLVGYLSPEFGGPATAYHSFRLSANASGGTTLRFKDASHGRVDAAQAQMLADGWKMLLAEGFMPYLESRSDKPAN